MRGMSYCKERIENETYILIKKLTVRDEGTNRVEQLPEGHCGSQMQPYRVGRSPKLTDFATNLGRCNFTYEYRSCCESHPLADTN
jgi:hypothetical protein